MIPYTIRLLRPDDEAALLRFELENRHWFEQHIEPRPQNFYSPAGVRAHIASFLQDYTNGTRHPSLILSNGAVIGRANLKDISLADCSAEVGYRIAQAHAGTGLATAAVVHLISAAREHWKLRQLRACVYARNAASRRVLEKNHFVCKARDPSADNTAVPTYSFLLDLTALS